MEISLSRRLFRWESCFGKRFFERDCDEEEGRDLFEIDEAAWFVRFVRFSRGIWCCGEEVWGRCRWWMTEIRGGRGGGGFEGSGSRSVRACGR